MFLFRVISWTNCLHLLFNIFLLEHSLIWCSPLPVYHITRSNEDLFLSYLIWLLNFVFKLSRVFLLASRVQHFLGFLSTWLIPLSHFCLYSRTLFLSALFFKSIFNPSVISSRLMTVNTNYSLNLRNFISSSLLSSELHTYISNCLITIFTCMANSMANLTCP